MIHKIKYVYGLDQENVSRLLGAKVITADFSSLKKQEIYVGIQFCLQDIMENAVNANALGIHNLSMFKKRYMEVNACGIIYFPQIDKYGFLQNGDRVLTWINDELVSTQIDEALGVYKSATNDSLELEDVFDLDDPMLELNDIPLSRTRCSKR